MRIRKEEKAGLYVTVIFHLVALIVLLISQISSALKGENSFLLDFSREEALEKKEAEQQKLAQEEAFGEEISRRIDDLISGKTNIDFKNTVVNRAELKDDRGTNAEQLYKEAQELADDLKKGFSVDESDGLIAEPVKKEETKQKESNYSGPSVVSYSLDGRKASRLPIPSYKCYGGGMVTVIIIVDNSGKVTGAKVQEEASSTDSCLREFAVRAAKMSRFSSDPKAPARHVGNIVYQFIAQ